MLSPFMSATAGNFEEGNMVDSVGDVSEDSEWPHQSASNVTQ